MWTFAVAFGVVVVLLLRINGNAPNQQVLLTETDSFNGSQIWQHPSSPNQYIDVRAFGLCYGQTLYSGYYHSDDDDVHLFFVYARASQNPETSPLALWTNGGPGTSGLSVAFSSATGCILEETGNGMKLSFKSTPLAKRWNENVNVIFIEQPIGTGFSYGSGPSGHDTRVGAEDIYNFIQVVLSRHPRIPSVSFHSLSYGGHFVPEWANKVIEENAKAQTGQSSNQIIPLKRVSMGNSWFGNDEQYLALFDTLCDDKPYMGGSPEPLLPLSECTRVKADRANCADLLQNCKDISEITCSSAYLWCWTALRYHFKLTGRAMFDLSAVSENIAAYDTYPALTRYLNLRPVQVALGVIGADEPRPREWEYYNESVSVLHILAGDHARPTDILLPKLIEAGIDILLYVGTLDLSCGFRAARKMIGSQELLQARIPEELKNWRNGLGRYLCSTNKKSGVGTFCYLEIDGAGHGVAYEYDAWGDIFGKWVGEGLF